MSDHLLKGTKNFILYRIHEAILHFDLLIDESPEGSSDRVLGHLYRGTCYCEMNEYGIALQDFEDGLKINKDSFELKYKTGIAQFMLEKYELADKTFRSALISSTNAEEREKLIGWQNKTLVELEALKKEREHKVGNIKFSRNWFQTSDNVVITFDCNFVINKNTTDIKIDKRAVTILVEGVKVHELMLSNAIKETLSSIKVLTQKIEVSLVKEIKGFNWITLDTKSAEEVQKYPSSYNKNADFTKIDSEIDKELRKEPDVEGDGMMTFFRSIYENSNEETKRAMMKSYSTSGGTVLSTSWEEVSQKDYAGKDRPSAPDGQIWADQLK